MPQSDEEMVSLIPPYQPVGIIMEMHLCDLHTFVAFSIKRPYVSSSLVAVAYPLRRYAMSSSPRTAPYGGLPITQSNPPERTTWPMDGQAVFPRCRGGSRTAPDAADGASSCAPARSRDVDPRCSRGPGGTGATSGTKFQSNALMRSRSSSANNMPWS